MAKPVRVVGSATLLNVMATACAVLLSVPSEAVTVMS
jgi:hypothetical protein